MADEMDGAIDAIGKTLDGGMDVLRQRFERLAAARIILVEGSEAAAFQRRLHLSERSRRPADAMQQDDAVLRHAGIGSLFTQLALFLPREIRDHVLR
jgi:hypothetical protein